MTVEKKEESDSEEEKGGGDSRKEMKGKEHELVNWTVRLCVHARGIRMRSRQTVVHAGDVRK